MQKFDTFFRHFLITNRATLLWFASGFVREAPGHGLRRFLPNVPQFGEHAAFSRQKAPQSLDCGAAIQVRHFWWEKSGAHAAMFSSAAAARLLHSF